MTTLNWQEIKTRAIAFSKEWEGEASERAEAQTFWNVFFDIFGIHRRRVGIYFENSVKKLNKNLGRIDCFWPGVLLIEHKSAGQNLEAAYIQATDYFAGLKDEELPRFILVSDFANFRLYDLDENTNIQFKLSELSKNIEHFNFVLGRKQQKIREQDPVNQKAVEKMGKLHDELKKDGYSGHALEVLLVRLLFCLFADDTGIFSPRDMMLEHLENDTKSDGSDLGLVLGKIFETLNMPYAQRQKSLPQEYAAYPYVNGKLFEEHFALPSFTANMRTLLLECCQLDWSKISPAIFGAMFQKVIELDEKDRRRQMGAHYTSEENILKLIGPLFLDELKAELEHIKHQQNQLFEFHKKITSLRFLDPACGCGNFLVITYRELRYLELEVLKAAKAFRVDIEAVFSQLSVNVDQFSGIEIEDFPAQIAQVAMWLIDHQMNMVTGELIEKWYQRIPLTKSANIRIGNALRIDWEAFCPPTQLNYILGNPPFLGKQNQNASQKEDMEFVTKGMKGAGVLDYVAAWYIKAAQYLSGSKVGSVSRDKTLFSDAEFSQKSSPLPMGEGAGVRVIQQKVATPDYLIEFARELRAQQTDAEQCMWSMLRNNQLLGFKFRRQHPINPYILDFYCHELKLAIELDGSQHITHHEKDQIRDDFLAKQGIEVLRFWSNQVLSETEAVMEAVYQKLLLHTAPLTPSPSPVRRGERVQDLFAQAEEVDASPRKKIRVAFVSTNSISQGEQVGVLWSALLAQGMQIHFAHRTFQWSNEAPGKAAVHCVIIGFWRDSPSPRAGEGLGVRDNLKRLFEYADIKSQPLEVAAHNINPYLVDAPNLVLPSRDKPISNVAEMGYGSKPTEGGNLLLEASEYEALIAKEPEAKKWIRPFLGADEFLNNIPRYCLWLKDITPAELSSLPEVQRRVKAVREMRLASTKAATVKWADYPTLFTEDRQPEDDYLLVPSVSSENRQFIPIGYISKEVVVSNANFAIPNATLYHFGILTSTMHNAWVRQVCGRLESRYRYSNTIVYNNFAWPSKANDAVEQAAQGVLDARAQFANESLASLYHPDTMPPILVKAHAELDKAVDAAYLVDGGAKKYATDAERVAFLFKRYQQLTSLI